jgi:hypothetical protein
MFVPANYTGSMRLLDAGAGEIVAAVKEENQLLGRRQCHVARRNRQGNNLGGFLKFVLCFWE